MKDWTPRLDRLIHLLDSGRDLTEEEEWYIHKTHNDGNDWGCCSVAQKMLKIESAWEHVDEFARSRLVQRADEKLFDLAIAFSKAVTQQNYRRAKVLHNQIQRHKVDNSQMSTLIRSALSDR